MKTFKQIVENIVVLDEAVMDQKMWDRTKKGDKLTISYDSGIKKGNKTTFVVGTKNIVGKAKVGKITMKREDGMAVSSSYTTVMVISLWRWATWRLL